MGIEAYGHRRIISELDPATPVVSLGDKRIYREESIVLFSDEERDLMASQVGQERVMRQRGIDTARRQRLIDSWWVRVGIGAGVIAAVADFILALKSVLT